MMEMEEYVKQIREKADTYDRTIQSIIAFDSAVRWDDDAKTYISNSHFMPGRRLYKGDDPGKIVTPDIAIQISDKYGIVAEVKLTASTDQDYENAHEQVEKYDTNLCGWKTKDEKIELFDLSLLVNDLHKGKAKRYFEKIKFNRKFTLIACARQYEVRVFFKIEKYYGSFSNPRLENKFIDPVAIPLENPDIIKRISSVKFYDAEPPVEYTMNVLWMNVFNEIMESGGREGEKTISISCKEVTKMLEERYAFKQEDNRQPKTPKEAWVRQALDAFVEIEYAYRDLKDNDRYHVKYSHLRKEAMLELFAKKCYEVKSRPASSPKNDRQIEFTGF